MRFNADPPRVGRRSARRWLTVLAGVLILLALTVPNRLEDMEPGAFVRLPVEAIVFLAIVLALPPRFIGTRRGAGRRRGRRARTDCRLHGARHRVHGGAEPAVRRVDRLALRRVSRGDRPWLGRGRAGVVLLVLAGCSSLALLVLLPLAVLRVTRVVSAHRGPALRVVAVLASLWLVLGAAGRCARKPARWPPGSPPPTSTAR